MNLDSIAAPEILQFPDLLIDRLEKNNSRRRPVWVPRNITITIKSAWGLTAPCGVIQQRPSRQSIGSEVRGRWGNWAIGHTGLLHLYHEKVIESTLGFNRHMVEETLHLAVELVERSSRASNRSYGTFHASNTLLVINLAAVGASPFLRGMLLCSSNCNIESQHHLVSIYR